MIVTTQILQNAGVIEIPRNVAREIIYDLRLPAIEYRQRLIGHSPTRSYDTLLQLHKAGSLTFNLDEVVGELIDGYFSKGVVE